MAWYFAALLLFGTALGLMMFGVPVALAVDLEQTLDVILHPPVDEGSGRVHATRNRRRRGDGSSDETDQSERSENVVHRDSSTVPNGPTGRSLPEHRPVPPPEALEND